MKDTAVTAIITFCLCVGLAVFVYALRSPSNGNIDAATSNSVYIYWTNSLQKAIAIKDETCLHQFGPWSLPTVVGPAPWVAQWRLCTNCSEPFGRYRYAEKMK